MTPYTLTGTQTGVVGGRGKYKPVHCACFLSFGYMVLHDILISIFRLSTSSYISKVTTCLDDIQGPSLDCVYIVLANERCCIFEFCVHLTELLTDTGKRIRRLNFHAVVDVLPRKCPIG